MATTEMEQPVFGIRLTFVDDLKNGFTTIGGAAWETASEQAAAWQNIPALADGDESDFIADLMGPDGINVLDEKRVSAETCEQLMGQSIATLIEQGREKTCHTLADIRLKRPDIANQYPAIFG